MNDDLASGRRRMVDVTMSRLSVGGRRQSEDDAERSAARILIERFIAVPFPLRPQAYTGRSPLLRRHAKKVNDPGA